MYACAKRGRYHGTKLAQYRVSAPQFIFAIVVLLKGGGGGGALMVLYSNRERLSNLRCGRLDCTLLVSFLYTITVTHI